VEVAERTVDEGGFRALEPGVEDGADDDVDDSHLGRPLRGAAGGQRGRRGVGKVCVPQPPRDLGQGVDPARLRRDPRHGLLDEMVGDGQDQIVLASEVPVDRGRVRAEGTAELRQAEPARPFLVQEPHAFLDDQFRRQAAAAQPSPFPAARPAAGCGGAGHRVVLPPWTLVRPGGRRGRVYSHGCLVIGIDINFGPLI